LEFFLRFGILHREKSGNPALATALVETQTKVVEKRGGISQGCHIFLGS
jgi:hypothetical protein